MASKKSSVRSNGKTTRTSEKTPRNYQSAKKREGAKTTTSVNIHPIESEYSQRRFTIRRPYFFAALAAIILLVIVYTARSFFVAAVVNGQPISRWSVIRSLEQQGGKQALQGIVTDTLISQEAAKRHVAVSQSDVDQQIKTIESNLAKQGQSLDAALQYQGMTRQNLTDRIRVQKLVDKMIGQVSVTDKEVTDYMDKNKDSLPQGATTASIKQQLTQQKLQAQEQTFVQNLQNKAKISYWVNY